MRTRNKLFSTIKNIYDELKYDDYEDDNNLSNNFLEYIYIELFSLTKNDIPEKYINFGKAYDVEKIFKIIRDIFSNYDYNDLFDFIEGIITGLDEIKKKERRNFKNYSLLFINKINSIFDEENVNYKIINNIVTDIVTEEEIKAINDSLLLGKKVTQNHVEKAIELLYKNKDYDNSIKEAISAVESECQILTKNDKSTLGQALKKIKDKIHPALKAAFEKLYGYTSDANGIRHANGLGEGNSTFAEAKYMLVSCSAFINYLRDEIDN